MSTTVRREAVVGPDGKIEINVPELQPGQHVTVTIQPEQTASEAPPEEKISMYDFIKDLPGGRLFKSAEEVDEYLRQERDSWER